MENKPIEQCECGNKTFSSIYSTEVTFTLDDKILVATDENPIGSNNIFICQKCDKEYTTSDFGEIDLIIR